MRIQNISFVRENSLTLAFIVKNVLEQIFVGLQRSTLDLGFSNVLQLPLSQLGAVIPLITAQEVECTDPVVAGFLTIDFDTPTSSPDPS